MLYLNFMTTQQNVFKIMDLLKTRKRCKLCPRKEDRKLSLLCLICKNTCCKRHLTFVCHDCLRKQLSGKMSERENLIQTNQNLSTQKYCHICGSYTYRKVTKQCQTCYIHVCKNHLTSICKECKPDTVSTT